jgi:hypothetical protein
MKTWQTVGITIIGTSLILGLGGISALYVKDQRDQKDNDDFKKTVLQRLESKNEANKDMLVMKKDEAKVTSDIKMVKDTTTKFTPVDCFDLKITLNTDKLQFGYTGLTDEFLNNPNNTVADVSEAKKFISDFNSDANCKRKSNEFNDGRAYIFQKGTKLPCYRCDGSPAYIELELNRKPLDPATNSILPIISNSKPYSAKNISGTMYDYDTNGPIGYKFKSFDFSSKSGQKYTANLIINGGTVDSDYTTFNDFLDSIM